MEIGAPVESEAEISKVMVEKTTGFTEVGMVNDYNEETAAYG